MTTLAEYWQRIDSVLADRHAHGELLDEIAGEILDDSSMTGTPDGVWAAAYCQYMHPARVDSTARQAEFLATAEKVLQLQLNHPHAWLFIGFNYFDSGNLPAAQRALARADSAELADDDRMKKEELELCCALCGMYEAAAAPLIEAFVDKCLQEDEFDVFPTHLLIWVKHMCEQTKPEYDVRVSIAQQIRRLVYGIHQERIFEDMLALVERWAQPNLTS